MQPVEPRLFPVRHLEERLWVKLHTTAGLICRVFSPKGEAQYLFLPPFRLHDLTFTLRWLGCIFIRVLQLIKNVHFYLPYWYFPLHSNNSLNTGSEECSKSPKLGQNTQVSAEVRQEEERLGRAHHVRSIPARLYHFTPGQDKKSCPH